MEKKLIDKETRNENPIYMLINFLRNRLKQMTQKKFLKLFKKRCFPEEKKKNPPDNSKNSAYLRQKIM